MGKTAGEAEEKNLEGEGASLEGTGAGQEGAGAEGAPEEGKESEGAGKGGEEPKGKVESLNPDTYTPPVRKTVADFVAERRGRKIQKVQSKEGGAGEENGEEGAGEGGNVDVTALIQEGIADALKPFAGAISEHTTKTEVQSFLAQPQNEQFRKYEKIALKEAGVYQNVPIEKIFYALAYEDALEIGAAKAVATQKRDQKNKLGGRSTRTQPPGTTKFTMKNIGEVNRRVMAGEKIEVGE